MQCTAVRAKGHGNFAVILQRHAETHFPELYELSMHMQVRGDPNRMENPLIDIQLCNRGDRRKRHLDIFYYDWQLFQSLR